jgi:hypothetical protein
MANQSISLNKKKSFFAVKIELDDNAREFIGDLARGGGSIRCIGDW